jgi:hypothetical protein
MRSTHVRTSVADFLAQLDEDAEMQMRVESAFDDDLIGIAQAIAAERGLSFSREELEDAVAVHLDVTELELTSHKLPPSCNTKSGCRSPCVYCDFAPVTE